MSDVTREMLEGRGVPWELVDLPIDDIDLVASITNQSRAVPIDQPTVDRYVAALADGATFPPVLARKTRTGPVILGGNHRTRAHLDAGLPTIRAYLVEVPDLVALELSYADNATHGLPPTTDERVAHALILVAKGRSVAAAARTVGIDRQRIDREQHLLKATKRAAELGVAVEMDLVPVVARPRLLSLRHDRTFVAATKAVVTHGLGGNDTIRLVADLNGAGTVTEQRDLLKAWLQRHGEVRRSGAGRPSEDPYLRLRAALATVTGLRPTSIVEAAGRHAAADLADRCRDAARHLADIHDQLRAVAS